MEQCIKRTAICIRKIIFTYMFVYVQNNHIKVTTSVTFVTRKQKDG